ncbi:hypothetical protein GCM10023185_29680 [Hymenobacter saemangeumensis]|uniref:Virion structural protein n=1 Tax=Hymenobacter saemangeumensis TaxID=1084522 RepID=A0ABP8IL49_9BACT
MQANEILVNGQLLDLDSESASSFLMTYQANDRTKPESVQSDYSPEFSAPATQRNMRIFGTAATAQNTAGAPYRRLPAVLVSGGVETMPTGELYVKGYQAGRYQLQFFAGNRRFVQSLNHPNGDPKKLSDLDLDRFSHLWTPANIVARLGFDFWQANGYGYELYDRGKELKLDEVDPYDLYPSVSARLVWEQILSEAGFEATNLQITEPLFAALNIPTAKPYEFSSDYRAERALVAGWRYQDGQMFRRRAEFGPIAWPFNFTAENPYTSPTAATFNNGEYTVSTLALYSITASLEVVLSCAPSPARGEVSAKVAIQVNGNQVGTAGEIRVGNYTRTTLTASAKEILLQPGDVVRVIVQGDEWQTFGGGPTNPFWQVGTSRPFIVNADGSMVEFGPPYNPSLYRIDIVNQFKVEMLGAFPRGGLVRLSDWLPSEMTQWEFVKTLIGLMGLTVQVDRYDPFLYLSTGGRVLANVSGRVLDWSAKLDRAPSFEGVADRETVFRFGEFARRNEFKWKEDETVTAGYGDGALLMEDETLPAASTLIELPFAASEESTIISGLLSIRGYRRRNPDPAVAAEYDLLSPQPRLVLRTDAPVFNIKVAMVPRRVAGSTVDGVFYPNDIPPVLQDAATSASYFAAPTASFDLDAQRTLLPRFWPDLAACLKETRFLKEWLRLTPRDIAELDFARPVWIEQLGDFFLVNKVNEYDPSRSVAVELIRLHPTLIPPPALGTGFEFYHEEFDGLEFF